jgi:hypothetical protein
MNIELNQDRLCLQPNQLVKVRGGIGHSVVCHRGSVWLTQQDDPRDIVLAAGEAFTLDRGGVALLQALGPGAISIGHARAQTRASALGALLKAALPGAGRVRAAAGI